MKEYESKFWDMVFEENCIMFWINERSCIALLISKVAGEER